MEQAPELTPEDEKLLDKAWAAVSTWKPAYVPLSKDPNPVKLGWGLNK
jgi:hypothetical protein